MKVKLYLLIALGISFFVMGCSSKNSKVESEKKISNDDIKKIKIDDSKNRERFLMVRNDADGNLIFKLSNRLKAVMTLGVFDKENKPIWIINLKGSSFQKVKYGSFPLLNDNIGNSDFSQIIPDVGKPPKLEVGDSIEVYFEVPHDFLLFSPSSKELLYRFKVPELNSEIKVKEARK